MLTEIDAPSEGCKKKWYYETKFRVKRFDKRAVLLALYLDNISKPDFLYAELQVGNGVRFDTTSILPDGTCQPLKLDFSAEHDPTHTLDFYIGLSHCCECTLLIHARTDRVPIVKIQWRQLSVEDADKYLSRPVDLISNEKMYRYCSGDVRNADDLQRSASLCAIF